MNDYEDWAWFDWFCCCVIGLLLASAFCASLATTQEVKNLKEVVAVQQVRIIQLETELAGK